MYTATHAIGVRLGIGKQWESIKLEDWGLAGLFSTFRRVQVTLSLPSNSAPLYLDLETLRTAHASDPSSLQVVLNQLGNAALPTTPTGLVIKKRTARFRDAFRAGYTVTPVTHASP